MPNKDHPDPPTGGKLRPYVLAGAVLALGIVCVTILLIARNDDTSAASSSTASRPGPTPAPGTTGRVDEEVEITTRLREILQIRERAFRDRNARLFDEVYTSDCSCLRAGRDAIAALRREGVIWRNRSISLEIQSARSLSDKLWEVVAVFVSDSFRIENEEGGLVREAPAERLRYRFLLVRSAGEETWRLGSASLVEGS
jgi:hypothetical protein